MTKLVEATIDDLDQIVSFLTAMTSELEEFSPKSEDLIRTSIKNSFADNVHWFIFHDEENKPFGTCYLQSVHNYWRLEKRFYLGGFYFAPTHRKQKRFLPLCDQLKKWATNKGGVQIYNHIHQDNKQSIEAFGKAGYSVDEYLLCCNHWGD